MAKRAVPFSIPANSGELAGVVTGTATNPVNGTFKGYTLRNSNASAVQVDIYDNATTNTGTLLATVDLTAVGTTGACQTFFYDEGGVEFHYGIYVQLATGGGVVKGSVFVG